MGTDHASRTPASWISRWAECISLYSLCWAGATDLVFYRLFEVGGKGGGSGGRRAL